jgi:hypothetical protein
VLRIREKMEDESVDEFWLPQTEAALAQVEGQ